jgi:hypothetical protein
MFQHFGPQRCGALDDTILKLHGQRAQPGPWAVADRQGERQQVHDRIDSRSAGCSPSRP